MEEEIKKWMRQHMGHPAGMYHPWFHTDGTVNIDMVAAGAADQFGLDIRQTTPWAEFVALEYEMEFRTSTMNEAIATLQKVLRSCNEFRAEREERKETGQWFMEVGRYVNHMLEPYPERGWIRGLGYVVYTTGAFIWADGVAYEPSKVTAIVRSE